MRPAPPPLLPLPAAGQGVSLTLSAGEVRRFGVTLAAGDFLEVAVDQRQVDGVLALDGPEGGDARRRWRVDRPDGRAQAESLAAVAAGGGRFEVTVVASEPGAAGALRLETRALRPAQARDRRRAQTLATFVEGQADEQAGRAAEAAERYGRAAEQWLELGDRASQALALACQSRVLQALGRPGAAALLSRALAAARAAGSPGQEAEILRDQARLFDRRGRPADAGEARRRARALFHQLGETGREAEAVSDLAKAADRAMRLGEAEEGYREALRLFERAGERENVARSWLNLGFLEARMGDPEQALERFRKVRDLTAGRLAGNEIQLLLGEATAFQALGRAAEARAIFRHVLDLRPAASRADRLYALHGLIKLDFQAKRCTAAAPLLAEALRLGREAGHRPDEAAALQNLASCAWQAGELDRAGEFYGQTRRLAAAAGSPYYEAAALSGLARVAFERGDLALAWTWVSRALAKAEAFRVSTPRLDLRTALFADYQGHFDLAIRILLRQNGSATWSAAAERAFEVSERGRTRRLLDVLPTPPGRAAGRRPVGLRQIERELLDDRTALLELDLGPDHSVLFVLTRESRRFFLLPPAETLQAGAESLHAALEASRHPDAGRRSEEAARRLAALLLPSVGPLVAGKERLRIAADGALHSIPWGVLRWPQGGPQAGRLLLETHAVVAVPGASAAYWMQRMPPRSPRLRLATVADPVFERTDERLPPPRSTPPPAPALPAARSIGDLEALALPRLAHAGREADTVLALVAPGARRDLRGFDASRERVLGGGIAEAAIVHFATHGFFDPRRPELSGIALSRFDRAGRRRRGYVTALDLQPLRLEADLVVLSACQTALGRKVPGEGPLGLSYALFQAGARTTVVSLWKVDDEATAALMQRFYERVLLAGAPPAEALRDAQLALRQRRRWQEPYYWAGFLVQGDGFSPV